MTSPNKSGPHDDVAAEKFRGNIFEMRVRSSHRDAILIVMLFTGDSFNFVGNPRFLFPRNLMKNVIEHSSTKI